MEEKIEEEHDHADKRFGRIMTGKNPGSLIELTATGATNGTNKDFAFAQKPKYVVVNGATYRENKGWSFGANDTVTLDFAPIKDSDVYGML